MTDIEILKELIKNEAQVELEDIAKRKTLTAKLIESESPGYSVTIKGIPSDTIIIKPDRFKSPDSIFNCSKGECKRADYVIISESPKKVMIFIEMKKKTGVEKEIIQQLQGARCFITYCQDVIRTFWKEQYPLKKYNYRYVSLKQIGIAKGRTTVVTSSKKHDSPEKMMKISYPRTLEFNKLTGQL